MSRSTSLDRGGQRSRLAILDLGDMIAAVDGAEVSSSGSVRVREYTKSGTDAESPQELDGGRRSDPEGLICVLTRFRLRSPLWLIPTYLDYRRIARAARNTDGLIREAFLIENPVTCYSLSIWSGTAAIGRFGTEAQAHLDAARRMNRRARSAGAGKREIWSLRWRLEMASHNVNWRGTSFADLLREGHTASSDKGSKPG